MVRSRSKSMHAFMFFFVVFFFAIVFFSVLACDTCTEHEACQERSGVLGCVCLDGQRPNLEFFGKRFHTCCAFILYIHLKSFHTLTVNFQSLHSYVLLSHSLKTVNPLMGKILRHVVRLIWTVQSVKNN